MLLVKAWRVGLGVVAHDVEIVANLWSVQFWLLLIKLRVMNVAQDIVAC